MPIGIYKRSPKQIKRLKKMGYQKGHPAPKTAFKKGHKPWCKGKHPPQLSGKNHHNWRGGRIYMNGYVFIHKPTHPFCRKSGYVREHRLIIEKYLRRYLLPTEKTHHLGKKDDNRIHLLMVFVNHSAHKRFEWGNKVKTKEIVFDGRHLNPLK